jgi:hypothetical protein
MKTFHYSAKQSGYGLDDRAIEVRSPAVTKIILLPSVSRPIVRPTQPPVQRVLLPVAKRGRCVMLNTQRRGRERVGAIHPPCASIGVMWDCLTLL